MLVIVINILGKDNGDCQQIASLAGGIRAEMTTCSGITARPLDVKQVSLEAARQVVPDSLYWLICFLVTGEAGKTYWPSQVFEQLKRASNI